MEVKFYPLLLLQFEIVQNIKKVSRKWFYRGVRVATMTYSHEAKKVADRLPGLLGEKIQHCVSCVLNLGST